jgi:transposase
MWKSFSVMISSLDTSANSVLAAALANKLARNAWSLLSQNRAYEPRTAAAVG